MKLTTKQLKQMIKKELVEMARRDHYASQDHGKWMVDREYVDNLASSLGASGGVIEDTTQMQVNYKILLGVEERYGSIDQFEVLLYKDRKRPLRKTNYGWFVVRREILKRSLMFPLSGDVGEDTDFINMLRMLSWNKVVDLANSQKYGDWSWVNQIMPGYYRG